LPLYHQPEISGDSEGYIYFNISKVRLNLCMVVTKGYHTLKERDNVDTIEESGPIKCTHSRAWLGLGYYFWDTNIEWAHSWGKTTYDADNYVIFEIDINRDPTMFDIHGDVSHQIILSEAASALKDALRTKPISQITVPNIIEYLKRHTDFLQRYFTIRAADNPDSRNIYYFSTEYKNFMYAAPRVQVCVMEKKRLLLRTFKVVYPEIYKQ